MSSAWLELESTTHQDHVVAHVIGTTVVGHFVFDETIHLLLDIGFVWTIYLDGQMVLLPHPVAISELELDEPAKAEIVDDLERLLAGGRDELNRVTAASVEFEIASVEFYQKDDRRRLVLSGSDDAITIESSIASREIWIV